MTEPKDLHVNVNAADEELDAQATIVADQWDASYVDEVTLLSKLYGTLESMYIQDRETGEKSKPKVACKSGCSWCCYMQVEVLPQEIDLIAREVARLPALWQVTARQDAATIARAAEADHSPSARLKRRQACPFLDPRTKDCRIYHVRPFVCRAHHSTRVSACRSDFYNIEDVTLERFQVSQVVLARAILLRAYFIVAERRGLPSDMTELSDSLHRRFSGG